MHDPVFAPGPGRYLSKEFRLFEGLAKLGAEDWRESFDGHQKVFPGNAPVEVISQPAAGDYVMHVRMIEELAGPGVKHADHAQAGADEPWVLSQLLQAAEEARKSRL